MATATLPVAGEQSGMLARPARIQSVDLLRGIVMAVMALDHVRDFLTHLRFQPEDMANTYAGLFLTRWLTHYSAPTFFFLAGTGAYFYGRTRTPGQVSKFLWTRGLFLMVMELTIVWWGWSFNFTSIGFGLLVIWTLGLSMVCLAGLIRLPFKALLGFSLGMIALHNLLLDPIRPAMLGKFRWLWLLLHQNGFYQITPQPIVSWLPNGFFVLYSLIPWVGVMAAGYCLGKLYDRPAAERRKILMTMGMCAVALFMVLRATNIYGNPIRPGGGSATPFQIYPSLEKTIISFFNVEKYPPSLDFLLMTLGPGLIFLALVDQFDFKGLLGKLAKPVLVIGKVPMFYYLLHLYLIHASAVVIAMAFGQPWKWLVPGGFFTAATPDGYGHNLPFIWMVWILTVAILYFPCRWYAQYKATHKAWWLSYI